MIRDMLQKAFIKVQSDNSVATPTAAAQAVATDANALPDYAAPAFSPLYQQIKGLILKSLQDGEWKPGEAIPSEMDLAVRYRVSQGTVRKAIDELAADNLLVRRQGKGTFVDTHAEKHAQYRFLKLVPDESDGTSDQNSEGPAERQITECKRIRATAEIAKLLSLRTGDPVWQAQRVLSFSGVPTILEDIWLPAAPFKGLTAERLANYHGSMYALFETEFGVRMVKAIEKIRALRANLLHSSLLKIELNTPLLSIERTAFTYNDMPMELRRGYYLTDTHHYRNELN